MQSQRSRSFTNGFPRFLFLHRKIPVFIYRVMPALHQGGRYYAYVGLGDTFKIALRGYEWIFIIYVLKTYVVFSYGANNFHARLF